MPPLLVETLQVFATIQQLCMYTHITVSIDMCDGAIRRETPCPFSLLSVIKSGQNLAPLYCFPCKAIPL